MPEKPDPTRALLAVAAIMLTFAAILTQAPAPITLILGAVILALVSPQRRGRRQHGARKRPRPSRPTPQDRHSNSSNDP